MKKSCILLAVLSLAVFQHCDDPEPRPIDDSAKGLPARWADMTLDIVYGTFNNSPTFTSRNLGYIGLTMYESVVHGSEEHRSVAAQLSEGSALPLPIAGAEYNWSLCLNAGQAYILKSLYAHASPGNLNRIDSLEHATYQNGIAHTDADVAERSVVYGRAIAAAIFEWSKTDGGHEAYRYNFDPEYEVPAGNEFWTAPFAGQSASPFPLHPYWGGNRTFIAANAALPVPAITPYSNVPGSDNYKLFEEVYTKQKTLSDEDKRIAAWWADDPTQTASPPGHSYNLATIAVTSANANIFTAAETYAKVGLAVADAFICCWKVKYTYHSIRPFRYIAGNIDPDYVQFWPEPPFPAFSSGHATQSAAAAIVMESVFGPHFPLIDNTYETRVPDFGDIQYRTRSFDNLWATAEECAYSRFLGGIHTRQDNEVGSAQGKSIGENVNALDWQN